jgi:hypothetical protein
MTPGFSLTPAHSLAGPGTRSDDCESQGSAGTCYIELARYQDAQPLRDPPLPASLFNCSGLYVGELVFNYAFAMTNRPTIGRCSKKT